MSIGSSSLPFPVCHRVPRWSANATGEKTADMRSSDDWPITGSPWEESGLLSLFNVLERGMKKWHKN